MYTKSFRIIFFLMALLAGRWDAFGQFMPKGSVLVNGTLSFSNADTFDSFAGAAAKTTTWNILSWSGYTVVDNLTAGISVDFTFGNANSNSVNAGGGQVTRKYSNVMIGPLIRYYVHGGFFLQGSVGWGLQNETLRTQLPPAEIVRDYNLGSVSLGAGYAIRMIDRAFIEPIFNFISKNLDGSTVDLSGNPIDYHNTFSGFEGKISITLVIGAK